MSSLQLTNDAAITVVSTGAAAGETTITSSPVNMAGYDSVMFLVLLGTQTTTAVITATAEQCTTSGGTYAPIVDGITGSNISASATDASGSTNNGVLMLDVFRPLDQFVECVVGRTVANSTILAIIALQYNAKKKPVVQPASILANMIGVGS